MKRIPRLPVAAFVLALGIFTVSANAATHPVPLDPKTDPAKCLECHNSDDNREFGSTGAAGPHGSSFVHILERRYELAQAVTPGTAVTNLFKNPDLVTSAGPYALCAKCHDLQNLMTNGTFRHQPHVVTDGLSCSACHTAHGLGGTNANLSGDHLVDFDLNVVTSPTIKLQYNSATRSCTLRCHNHNHNNAKY